MCSCSCSCTYFNLIVGKHCICCTVQYSTLPYSPYSDRLTQFATLKRIFHSVQPLNTIFLDDTDILTHSFTPPPTEHCIPALLLATISPMSIGLSHPNSRSEAVADSKKRRMGRPRSKSSLGSDIRGDTSATALSTTPPSPAAVSLSIFLYRPYSCINHLY